MKKLVILLALSVFLSLHHNLLAQPSVTPAAGYSWVLIGTGSYTAPTVSTTPSSLTGGDTSYGAAGDSDPADCSSYCGGNCDGVPIIAARVFAAPPAPTNSCEQRAAVIDHWNNTNPESAVSNGATTGTVHLPTSATVNILSNGTGAGGDDNQAWIIGGDSGNNTEFNTSVDYSIDWHVPDYSLSGGSGNQNYNFTWNWGDPGNGNEIQTSGWNNYTTNGFGNSFSDNMAVPLASIVETGGTFEVIFEANSAITVTRNANFGADARVQHGPGMEGTVNYEVQYDIWQLELTLPVEFTYIEARQMDRNIVVSWQTAMEINADSYGIQRSTDGGPWETIGTVAAAGNTDDYTEYQYIDRQPSMGVLRYRLLQVDLDGKSTYSPTAEVRHDAVTQLQLYPTTADHTIYLSGLSTTTASYTIVDVNGQLVQAGDLSDRSDISIDQLQSGVYFLLVQASGATTPQPLRFVRL